MNKTKTETKDLAASQVDALVMCMGKRDKKRFAKLMAIISIYHQDPDWNDDIKQESQLFAIRLADRYNFPNGWHKLGSYDDAARFFKEKCT